MAIITRGLKFNVNIAWAGGVKVDQKPYKLKKLKKVYEGYR
jgi:hypothetical protein